MCKKLVAFEMMSVIHIEAEDKSKCRLFRWQVSQREKDSCRCGECGPSVSYILLVFL